MSDQRVCRVYQMRKSRIVKRLADERLSGGVDIFSADLKQIVIVAILHYPVKLLARVPCRHVCDCVELLLMDRLKKKGKIIVLELLSLFVSRDRSSDISEISVCRDTAELFRHRDKIRHFRAFVCCRNIKLFDHIAFQNAENVVFVKVGVLFPRKDLSARFFAYGNFQIVNEEIKDILAIGKTGGYFFRKREKNVPFRDRASLGMSRKGKNVLFVVKAESRILNELGDVFTHLFVALVSVRSVRRKPRIDRINVLVRDPVHRNVCDRDLVGVVNFLAFQRRCGSIDTAFDSACNGHIQNFARFDEFLCAG